MPLDDRSQPGHRYRVQESDESEPTELLRDFRSTVDLNDNSSTSCRILQPAEFTWERQRDFPWPYDHYSARRRNRPQNHLFNDALDLLKKNHRPLFERTGREIPIPVIELREHYTGGFQKEKHDNCANGQTCMWPRLASKNVPSDLFRPDLFRIWISTSRW